MDAVMQELFYQILENTLERSYDRTENCELEAMFLAAFDQCASLFSGHLPPALT